MNHSEHEKEVSSCKGSSAEESREENCKEKKQSRASYATTRSTRKRARVSKTCSEDINTKVPLPATKPIIWSVAKLAVPKSS